MVDSVEPALELIHKFGGTSLAGAAEFRRVVAILGATQPRPLGVVVSASAGVTDALHALLALAERGGDWPAALAAVRSAREALVARLLAEEAAEAERAALAADCERIADVLRAAAVVGRSGPAPLALVAGHGETWSARLLTACLRDAGIAADWFDARRVVTVAEGELGCAVDWQATRELMQREWTPPPAVRVITGYVARDAGGAPATLGRNGSDYTASIFAALLDAREVVIWTDVDGVMSGDPRRIGDARVIPALSYHEAMELAYFGAKVIHPRTMAPLTMRGIPVRIRNTARPEHPGSLIGPAAPEGGVKGITTIGGMALLNLEGAGLIGVPGTASRLFGALREAGVSVVLISQGSSEHSICCAVPSADLPRAKRAAEHAFAAERSQGLVEGVGVVDEVAILAIVGDGMRGAPGVAAKLFGALGRAGVNVRAIAQGASERNISAVVDAHDADRALRAVHAGFYLSPQTLSVGLLGPGGVGATLLAQLAAALPGLHEHAQLELRLRAVAGSRRMVLAEALDPARWREALESGREADLDAFADHVRADHLPHAVIVDCTASGEVAARYADWMARGIHVVTPNKRAATAPLADWKHMHARRREGNARYFGEATVGAGLPVIQTLRDLRQTGDEILAIEGMLSGTLAFLFSGYDGTTPFSALLREARRLGYTEPDPREDLSGLDVARKLVILAREMGRLIELDDVAVDSLVPAALAAGGIEDFLAGLSEHDEAMRARLAMARTQGQVLRHVARLDAASGRASVGLAAVPADHPFAHARGTDNVVRFVTRRYHDNPLVVQGPGAGREVTAGGVFADLLRLAAFIGADL